MNDNDGAKSTNGKYNPVKTTAHTPETSVARWFLTYPIVQQGKYPKYNVNGRFLELDRYRKGDYCSAVASTVAVDVLVSDCKIWIFSNTVSYTHLTLTTKA